MAKNPNAILAGVFFLISAAVSASTRREVERRCKTSGYTCHWWAKTELDMLVKGHPAILDEFFGLGKSAKSIGFETIHPLHQLPSPPPDFTGRDDELAQLTKPVKVCEERSIISCIRGMAGVGKTALALVAANHIAGQFPDGQIFIDLHGVSEEQALTSGEILSRVIHAFHPDVRLPESVDELQVIYRSILSEKRVLLLMDNALDANQVRRLIPIQYCWLLITSRQRFELPGHTAIDLDVLSSSHACQLLHSICGRTKAKATHIGVLSSTKKLYPAEKVPSFSVTTFAQLCYSSVPYGVQ